MNKRKDAVLCERPKGPVIINILLMLYMVSVPLFTMYKSLNLISQGIFIVAFGGIAALLFFKNKKWKMDTGILFFLCFIAFCVFSLLWTKDVNSTVMKLFSFAQLLILYILLYSYISNYDCIDALILGLFISGLILSVVVISFYGITEYIRLMLKGYRLGGMINNVNTIGLYMAVTVIIGFYYGYIKGKSWLYIVDVLPLFVGFGTGSRKCLVMMALGIGLIVFIQYREKMNVKAFGKLLMVLLIVVAVIWWLTTLPVFRGAFDRILSMLGAGGKKVDETTILRGQMVEAGWDYFINHPLSGLGIGCSWILTGEVFGWETYLHNNFIELLACTGIIGFSLWHFIYVYLIKGLYSLSVKKNDYEAMLMLTIMVSTLLMSYGGVNYLEKMTYIYFAMASGILVIGKKKEKGAELNGKNPHKNKEGDGETHTGDRVSD